jgi:anti-anti-sigma factor
MKSSVTVRKQLTILKIEEETFDFRHSEAFRSEIGKMLTNEQSKNLIIDLSPVKNIDTSTLSSILFAHQLANQNDGVVIFVSLCKPIKDLLKEDNLDKQLYIYSSVNDVMTRIDPGLKGKKTDQVKENVHPDEVIDEIVAIPDLHDLELDEHADAPLVAFDEANHEHVPSYPADVTGHP